MTDSAKEGGTTPGPWRWETVNLGDFEGDRPIRLKNWNKYILHLNFAVHTSHGFHLSNADAHLIASAPQLRDLLRECYGRLPPEYNQGLMEKIREVLGDE